MADKKKLDPRIKKRLKYLLKWAGVVVILLIVQSFLWNGVNRAATGLHEVRSQSQQIKQVKEDFTEISERFESQRAFLDQLSVVVPLKRDTLQLIERLEGVANGLGLEIVIDDIVEGSAVEADMGKNGEAEPTSTRVIKNAVSVIPFTASISLNGPPEGLLSFIESVEHIQEITHISTLNMTAGASQSTEDAIPSGNTYNALMDIVFYLQTDQDGE